MTMRQAADCWLASAPLVTCWPRRAVADDDSADFVVVGTVAAVVWARGCVIGGAYSDLENNV